ncbi:MAG: alkaline phosphatase family protein [Fimbriimonas sp.]
MPKKVLLCVVDALTPATLVPALAEGRLPTLRALVERGAIHTECTSIFPSITHACLSSIATGEYPLEHGIVGSFWYDEESKELAYYGAQFWVILNQGIDKFLEDLLGRMNMERLHAPTVFEILERAGMRAASLNHLIYRGDHRRSVREPFVLRPLPVVTSDRELSGPSIFQLGDFVPLELDGERVDLPSGATNRFGICDAATMAALEALVEHGLPDFTLAYFPDHDVEAHAEGPAGAVPVLEEIDAGLARIVDRLGGLDRFLEEHVFLMHGDHAQTDVVGGEDRGGILVNELLKGMNCVHAGEVMDECHEVLVAPNLRTAFLYLRDLSMRERVVDGLLADPRVDQVFWAGEPFGEDGFAVQTRDRGSLRFWPGADGDRCAYDEYGGCWSWDGDLATLDARVEGRLLQWGAYPNAFERVAGGLGPRHAGHVWATAKPGFGFRLPKIKAHAGGGSHASLHAGDSYTALIAAGLPDHVAVPSRPRIVDTAPLVLKTLGLMGHGLGQSRILRARKGTAVTEGGR